MYIIARLRPKKDDRFKQFKLDNDTMVIDRPGNGRVYSNRRSCAVWTGNFSSRSAVTNVLGANYYYFRYHRNCMPIRRRTTNPGKMRSKQMHRNKYLWYTHEMHERFYDFH